MRRLGKYELLRSLAPTALAERHLARAPGDEVGAAAQPVMIEQLLPRLAQQDQVRAAFVREAQRAARGPQPAPHPQLLRVIEVCELPGECFVVLEHLPGHDLDAVVARAQQRGGGLPDALAAFVVTCLCRGLQQSHSAETTVATPFGEAHGGVHAANVFLGHGGEVRLGGGWLAAAAAVWATAPAGAASGGPAYASPEQWRGEPIDGRSDVFSLGALLYELLGRRPLFGRPTLPATREAVLHEPIAPLGTLRDDLSAALAAVAMTALQREREARYASAQEFEYALDQVARAQRWSAGQPALASWLALLMPASERAAPAGDALAAPLPRVTTAPWAREAGEAVEEPYDAEEAQSFLDEVPTVEAAREVLAGLVRASAHDERSAAESSPPAPAPAGPERRSPPTPARGASQRTTDLLPRARPSWTPLWWSAGVLCVVALLAVGWRLWRDRSPVAGPTVLELNTTPVAVRVYSEGQRPLGETPLVLSDLAPGVAHTLVFSAEGYRAATRVVRLRPGEQRRLAVTLAPERQAQRFVLDVVTRPAGAAVFVDGTRRGTTPLRLDDLRRAESHALHLRRDGYIDFSQTIDDREAARLAGVLDVELKRVPPPPLRPRVRRRAPRRRSRPGVEIPRGRVESGLRRR